MSSRAASKKAARDLLALCAKEGVKVPTDPINAAVEAGTMLNATRENGEFQLDAALKEMIQKFGVKEVASPVKKTNKKTTKEAGVKEEKKEKASSTRGHKRKNDETDGKVKAVDDEDSDDDTPKAKKQRQKPQATCEANQGLADAFAELSGFEFKRGEKFKGGTWSKVAKAIRDCEEAIATGKQALKLKGVGKSSAAKIDEFLETGTLEKLEDYRAGNM